MAKSKSAVSVLEAPDSTEITPHEVLPAVVRLTPEQQAAQEVQKFDVAKTWIATAKEEYKDLKIVDSSDKEGYAKVKTAWQTVREKRIATEKKREEIKSGYLLIGKKIDSHAKELIAGLTEIEDPLKLELERIDNEKKEAAAKKEREEQEKLQRRVAELLENGMGFSGSYYTLGDTISMDVVTLKAMSAEQYCDFLSIAKNANAAILQAKADKEKAEQDERDRLKKVADDQAKESLRLKEQQDELDRKNKILKDRIVNARSAQLKAIGMAYSYQMKVFEFMSEGNRALIGMEFVETAEDEVFDAELDKVTASIQQLKETARRAQVKRDEEKAEADRLKEIERLKGLRTIERERDIFEQFGMRKALNSYRIDSKIAENNSVSMSIATLEEMDVNGWANVMNEVKKAFKKFQSIDARRHVEDAEAKELRRLSKMDDGGIISDVIARMSGNMLRPAAFKTEAGQEIWDNFASKWDALIQETEDKINSL